MNSSKYIQQGLASNQGRIEQEVGAKILKSLGRFPTEFELDSGFTYTMTNQPWSVVKDVMQLKLWGRPILNLQFNAYRFRYHLP